MEGDRETGGGESFMMAVPDRGVGKKRGGKQTENLAARGLEGTPSQSYPLLSSRYKSGNCTFDM